MRGTATPVAYPLLSLPVTSVLAAYFFAKGKGGFEAVTLPREKTWPVEFPKMLFAITANKQTVRNEGEVLRG